MSDAPTVVLTTFSPLGDHPATPTFGDLIESPWLGDLHLQPTSERLMPVTMKGGRLGFRPAEEHEQSAQWIGYSSRSTSAQRPIRAVIVSDECQVEDVLRGRPAQEGSSGLPPGGRLLLAPLRPAAPDEMTMDAFKRAPVGGPGRWPVPEQGFDHGGIIDFDQAFNVKLAEADAGVFAEGLIGRPDDRELLLRRWSAYAVRRGPLVAQTAATQLRSMLDGDHDPDGPMPAVFELLSTLWSAEGAIEDLVSDAMEQVRLADDRELAREEQARHLRQALPKAFRRIASLAATAADEISPQ